MNRKKKFVLIVAGILLSLGLMVVGILAATSQSLYIRGRLSTMVRNDEDVLVNATVWFKVADDEYQKLGTKFATTDFEDFDADIDMRDELSVTYKIVMINYGIAADLDITVSDEDDTQFSDNFGVTGSDTEDFADHTTFTSRPKAGDNSLKEFTGDGVVYLGAGFEEETTSTYYVRFNLLNPKNMTLNYSMLLEFNEASAETSRTVTFESNGGSYVPGITGEPGTVITAPEDPVRDGYDFDAWYTTAALEEVFVFDEMPDTSIRLYAGWIPIVYTITYANLQDGTNPNVITQYTIETATITFAPPEGRNDYTGSWDITEIPLGSTGNKTITAVWAPIVYSITYANLQGGTNPNAAITQYTIETATITFAPPERDGYIGSWDITEIPLGSTGDKTITAVWTPIVYSITYANLQDGTNPNAAITQYTVETTTITFAPPERDGYTGSWDITEIPLGSTGNKVITAVWETKAEYFVFDESTGTITAISEEARALAEIIIPQQINGTAVTTIGTDVFRDCANLTSVIIPPGVTSIGNTAFYSCANLSSITLLEGLTSIGSSAFNGCKSLNSITLPEGLTSIGSAAFRDCTNLSSITLPEGLTSIGTSAFRGCTSLSSITLPESLTYLDGSAFYNCTLLAAVYVGRPASMGLTTLGTTAFDNCHASLVIYVPDANSVTQYKTAANWSTWEDKIQLTNL